MILFLYGPDTFRAKRKLKELKDKFRREIDKSGNDIAEINGEAVTLNLLNEHISPASLFSKKRMVIIENIFKNKSAGIFADVLKLLKRDEKTDNIIIFLDEASAKEKLAGEKNELFKFLSGQKYSQSFDSLSPGDLAKWMKNEASKSNADISPTAISLLSAMTDNLWQADSELKKIIAYKEASGSGKEKVTVTEKDVFELVRGKLDTNIFTFTDSLGAKNKAMALKLLEDQIEEGVPETYLLTMIIRQFKILLGIRQALDLGESGRNIASVLKLHPFIVQKGISQARFFTLDTLKNIMKRLVEIDYELKTGQGNLKTNLGLLIAAL